VIQRQFLKLDQTINQGPTFLKYEFVCSIINNVLQGKKINILTFDFTYFIFLIYLHLLILDLN